MKMILINFLSIGWIRSREVMRWRYKTWSRRKHVDAVMGCVPRQRHLFALFVRFLGPLPHPQLRFETAAINIYFHFSLLMYVHLLLEIGKTHCIITHDLSLLLFVFLFFIFCVPIPFWIFWDWDLFSSLYIYKGKLP